MYFLRTSTLYITDERFSECFPYLYVQTSLCICVSMYVCLCMCVYVCGWVILRWEGIPFPKDLLIDPPQNSGSILFSFLPMRDTHKTVHSEE